MSQPSSNDTFDSGLEICYEILLYLSSRLAKLPEGGVFEFITTDPTAMEKIPTWCETREYDLLSSEVLPDGRQRFLIKK